MEFTSLQLFILVFMYVFHLGPWVFVSSQGKSLAEVQNRAGNGRGVSRRRGWPAARGKWGKMERSSRATFGWPWLVGRGSEEAGPRRGAAGGGSELRWWCSGGVGVVRSGWEALVGCEEGCGALDFGNVEAEGGVPRSSGARRRGWPPARGVLVAQGGGSWVPEHHQSTRSTITGSGEAMRVGGGGSTESLSSPELGMAGACCPRVQGGTLPLL